MTNPPTDERGVADANHRDAYDRRHHIHNVERTMQAWSYEYMTAIREGRVDKWCDAVIGYIEFLRGMDNDARSNLTALISKAEKV